MIPKPGHPVRGSRTGRPIMALLDLLGRRWTLRILWELRRGPLTFAELQERCDAMSPSVLNQRLGELRDSRIAAHERGGYRLTEEGRSLIAAMAPLDDWAKRWSRR
jgi:DNA-binding HxlR family transcriptional regulator